ncbi:50S ribosomal protein L10 [Candidatus Uhrbacteria bacterium]|nr:50S ribosomal protein L10 [Candidatus Uhrbacteria bacterium]
MARSKASKVTIGEQLRERLGKSTAVVFANLQGLKVKEAEELRKACKGEKSECVMAKKTLLTRVFQDNGYDVNVRKFEGEVAAIFGYADEIAPAKVAATFAKTHEALKILGGIMPSAPADSRILNAGAVQTLAKLPSKDELRAKIVGTIANPLRGMVGVLQGNLRSLVYVLNAVKNSKA